MDYDTSSSYVVSNKIEISAGENGRVILTMPTQEMLTRKITYIKEHNLGGSIIWMLGQDDSEYTMTKWINAASQL